MRHFFYAWHVRLLSGFLVCGLAGPVLAQQRSDDAEGREDRRTQQDRQLGERFQRDRQQRDPFREDRSPDVRRQDRRQPERQREREARLRPAGWITIGVDSNQDGRFDAVERIYAFDLETAREQSRKRRENAAQSDDQWVEIQPRETSQAKDQLRGSVLRTRSAHFRGHDDPFLVAELRTADGERRLVNMGPKEKFDDVDFADTNEIQVLGRKGKVNGEAALIAEYVRIDGETINVKPEERRDRQWRDPQRERETRDRRLGDGRRRDRGERDGRRLARDERDSRLLDRGEGERRVRDRGEREERREERRGDREARDGRVLDRGDREERPRDREERDGRLRDRGDREGPRWERGEREGRFLDREDREGRLLDREDREGRLLERRDREGRRLDRGERERRILNRETGEESDRDDGDDDDRERDEDDS